MVCQKILFLRNNKILPTDPLFLVSWQKSSSPNILEGHHKGGEEDEGEHHGLKVLVLYQSAGIWKGDSFLVFFIHWNNMTITMKYWFQFDNKLHIFHGKKSWRQILWRKSSNLDICSLCLYHSCQNGDSGSPIQHGQVLAWRISNCWWWWWWR